MTELSEIDCRLIGGNKRITIPMESRQLLGESLDMLRRLCNDIEHALQRPGLTDRQVLMIAGSAVHAYQNKLQGICAAYGVKIREGRPTNAERLRKGGKIVQMPRS